MNSNLATDTAAAERNTDKFIDNFAALCNAGIGVTLCRTREPMRAADAVREFATATGRPFRLWTLSHGWATYDSQNPEAEATTDKLREPIPAMEKLVDPQSGFEENSISVMMYPHQFIAKSAMLVQITKDYSRMFADSDKRLMLLVPPSFQLPEELENDLAIVEFDPPSYAELADSYNDLMGMLPDEDENGKKLDLAPKFTDAERDRILSAGTGMTAHEFDNAVSRALVAHRDTLPNADIDSFVKIVSDVKAEVVKRSEVLEVLTPGKMSEIGGLENLKDWVSKRAKCFSPEARAFGIEPPKGIALIGPPGTGKSLGAKAIADVLGIMALKFDVGKVFNSLVGESEARVRAALKMVDDMAPCVLMIDEADKAFAGQAGGRAGGDSGVGMRVLGAILTWMQETKSPVFLVVTANRVDNLPTEFLRRGRLDEIFSVSTPHEDERLEILQIHLRKRGHDPASVEGLADIAAQCAGYVPSELEAAVKDSLIEAYVSGEPLTGELVLAQIREIRPLSVAFADDFRNMEQWGLNNARPASAHAGAVATASTAPRARSRGNRKVSLDG